MKTLYWTPLDDLSCYFVDKDTCTFVFRIPYDKIIRDRLQLELDIYFCKIKTEQFTEELLTNVFEYAYNETIKFKIRSNISRLEKVNIRIGDLIYCIILKGFYTDKYVSVKYRGRYKVLCDIDMQPYNLFEASFTDIKSVDLVRDETNDIVNRIKEILSVTHFYDLSDSSNIMKLMRAYADVLNILKNDIQFLKYQWILENASDVHFKANFLKFLQTIISKREFFEFRENLRHFFRNNYFASREKAIKKNVKVLYSVEPEIISEKDLVWKLDRRYPETVYNGKDIL